MLRQRQEFPGGEHSHAANHQRNQPHGAEKHQRQHQGCQNEGGQNSFHSRVENTPPGLREEICRSSQRTGHSHFGVLNSVLPSRTVSPNDFSRCRRQHPGFSASA